MDGVWLPAGGENPRVRGFPDSRHTPTARDCQGGGLLPLGPPPFNPGEQISIVREAEPDQTEPAKSEPAKPAQTRAGLPSYTADRPVPAEARNPSGVTGASRIEIRDLSVVQNRTLTYTQHSTASLNRQLQVPGGAGQEVR